MTIHDQMRNLERRPEWALVRPNYRTVKVARAWLEHSKTVATSDARQGNRCALTALRLTKAVGHRCLRADGLALYGAARRMLGDLGTSEKCFAHAFRIARNCSCCLPELNRQFAYVLAEMKEYVEAERIASLALSLYQERGDHDGAGQAYLCRGYVHWLAGNADASIEDARTSLRLIDPGSRFYNIAYQNLTVFLSDSDSLAHVKEAVALVPDVRERFVGLRDVSVERSKLDWMEGGVLARLAKLDPDLDYLQRYSRRSRARDLLADTLDALVTQGMPLEVAAVGADLAAVEAVLNATRCRVVVRLLLSNTLYKLRRVGAGTSFQPIRRAMRDVITATHELASTGPMWAALRKLRDLTVEAGCAPPLVPYLDPAEAL